VTRRRRRSRPRRPSRLIWVAVTALYAVLLLAGALLYVSDPGASAHDKLAYLLVLVGVPALAFLGAAVPLWRRTRNRALLVLAAIVAVLTGVFEGIVTFGLAFPISMTLFGVAVADIDRVAILSGYTGSRRALALWILLMALALLVGLAVPFVLVGIGAGLVVLVWRTARKRSRSRRLTG
jgi:hypothetical protein